MSIHVPAPAEGTKPDPKDYFGLVHSVALDFKRRLPEDIHLDDLEQAGMVGLMEAIGRFDCARPDRFGGYAVLRIRGEIQDFLRREDVLSLGDRQKYESYKVFYGTFLDEHGREPDAKEILSGGFDVDEIERIRLLISCGRWASLG